MNADNIELPPNIPGFFRSAFIGVYRRLFFHCLVAHDVFRWGGAHWFLHREKIFFGAKAVSVHRFTSPAPIKSLPLDCSEL
jgi:hypothetical protein